MFLVSATFFDAVVIVLSSILTSLAILWMVRHLVSHEQLKPHNEVSGFVYAAIGVVYAVVLGFAVISVWEEYREAESNVTEEANALGNLHRIAEGLPQPMGESIQRNVLAYASTVVNDEWDAMGRGAAPSADAVRQIDTFWTLFYQGQPTTPVELELFAEGLDQLDDLSGFRRERITASDDGMLGIMWGVIIAGAVLTVLFPCLFGVENPLVHSLIIATLAASLGLLLFLAYDLNHPFRGHVRVEPDGIQRIIDQFSPPESRTIFAPVG